MKKLALVIMAFAFGYGFGTVAFAENVPIEGSVESQHLTQVSMETPYLRS